MGWWWIVLRRYTQTFAVTDLFFVARVSGLSELPSGDHMHRMRNETFTSSWDIL